MKRIQIDISEEKLDELEKLMELSGIQTKKEFLNNAITLLKWAICERMTGRTIASIDESNNRYKELLMPILSSVPRKANTVEESERLIAG